MSHEQQNINKDHVHTSRTSGRGLEGMKLRGPAAREMASQEQLNKLKIGMRQLRDNAHSMSLKNINNSLENLKLK